MQKRISSGGGPRRHAGKGRLGPQLHPWLCLRLVILDISRGPSWVICEQGLLRVCGRGSARACCTCAPAGLSPVAYGKGLLSSIPPGSRRAFRNVILSGFDSMLFGVNDKWRNSGNSSFIYLWKSQNFLHIPPRDNPEGRLRIIKKFVKVYSLIKVSDISEMVALKTHTR